MVSHEVLILQSMPIRASKMLRAIAKHLNVTPVSSPTDSKGWLILWGWGGRVQQAAIQSQLARGGHVLSLDIGYFNRAKKAVRISVDSNHPQRLLKYANCDSRWKRLGIQLEDLYNEQGHIVLAGLGPKSRDLYGYSGTEFERGVVARIKAAIPDTRIVYRPKPNNKEILDGCEDGSEGDIRQCLDGASLCVVHHSNVAVDCAIYGVPCACVDGAGAFLYGSEIARGAGMATRAARLDFLQRVAWFNWEQGEEREMLRFVDSIANAEGHRFL